ncbi:von Willebrand factor type A domain-containing protein [Sphingomonas canadensis]|uniref:von Willebrand factor type A domain-containing protein n=1 Tax=Sphingomonas canadensis TaxID=1219257 RepID=A0ABW3H5V3_9SPHN|nr:VWA domain-containing protein [Sphingomonas canadensis]MCW3835808.1 VWA domain-containing protein [Sphingomonas canadensis]
MRVRLLGSAALGAALLAGCSQGGSYSAGPVSTEAYADPAAMPPEMRERYARNDISPVRNVAEAPVSTFAVDVDTAAYSNVRRFLVGGATPPRDAVRTEEMINYFRYDYPLPADRGAPFSVTTDVSTTPWNPQTRLLRVGLRGYDLNYRERPAANLVFLVDVSGSMDQPDKLPLVKAALATLADGLRPQDRVSIVVYAGAAGLVLAPTSDRLQIKAALDNLNAGGSTAGGEGIQLAYATARANRIEGGINRVILATDGDFNVGLSDQRGLEELIERNRDDGITLTALGFGRDNLNDAMMEAIADKGNGNYAYIDTAMEARKVLDEQLGSTLFTIAGDVKVQVEFDPAAVSQYRLIGYENRALREEDFKNDQVDAGEIGAGHQVTAIYEIVPTGAQGWSGPRRYAGNQPAAAPAQSGSGEMAFVKLRYKLPGEKQSRLIERPVPRALIAGAAAPQGDMAFAVAVAGFAQKLRGDTLLGSWSYADIRRLAGSPADYWRREFVELVGIAESGRFAAEADGLPENAAL